MFYNQRNWFQRQTDRFNTQTIRALAPAHERCLICDGWLRQHSSRKRISDGQSSHNRISDDRSSHKRISDGQSSHNRISDDRSFTKDNSHAFNESIFSDYSRPQLGEVCFTCQAAIPWIDHIHCDICGRYEVCYDCRRRQKQYFVCNRSAVRYDATMKTWLSQYKYRKNERLAPLLITMLLPTFKQLQHHLSQHGAGIDGITYIPLNKQRMEERGFNQAESIARGLAEASGHPLIPLLIKTRHTHKQSYKNRAARLRDLAGAFQFYDSSLMRHISKNISRDASRKMNIIVVDDVFTTGSTLNEAARIITGNLPCNIYSLTWAR